MGVRGTQYEPSIPVKLACRFGNSTGSMLPSRRKESLRYENEFSSEGSILPVLGMWVPPWDVNSDTIHPNFGSPATQKLEPFKNGKKGRKKGKNNPIKKKTKIWQLCQKLLPNWQPFVSHLNVGGAPISTPHQFLCGSHRDNMCIVQCKWWSNHVIQIYCTPL